MTLLFFPCSKLLRTHRGSLRRSPIRIIRFSSDVTDSLKHLISNPAWYSLACISSVMSKRTLHCKIYNQDFHHSIVERYSRSSHPDIRLLNILSESINPRRWQPFSTWSVCYHWLKTLKNKCLIINFRLSFFCFVFFVLNYIERKEKRSNDSFFHWQIFSCSKKKKKDWHWFSRYSRSSAVLDVLFIRQGIWFIRVSLFLFDQLIIFSVFPLINKMFIGRLQRKTREREKK